MSDSDKKPDSLYQLLLALQAVDDLTENIDLSAQVDLMDGAKVKVDNYKYLLDKLEAQEFYLSAREKEYSTAKKTIQTNIKRIREHLIFAMNATGFEKFTGNEYAVTLQKGKGSVHLKMGEPDVMKAIHYSNFVRTEYSWDKTAIQKALADGNAMAKEIAEIKINTFPKFSVLKEGVK
jgi:hypothetical protein